MSRLYLRSQYKLRVYTETFGGNKHKFILNGVNLAKLTGMFFTVPPVIPRDIFNINPVFI